MYQPPIKIYPNNSVLGLQPFLRVVNIYFLSLVKTLGADDKPFVWQTYLHQNPSN